MSHSLTSWSRSSPFRMSASPILAVSEPISAMPLSPFDAFSSICSLIRRSSLSSLIGASRGGSNPTPLPLFPRARPAAAPLRGVPLRGVSACAKTEPTPIISVVIPPPSTLFALLPPLPPLPTALARFGAFRKEKMLLALPSLSTKDAPLCGRGGTLTGRLTLTHGVSMSKEAAAASAPARGLQPRQQKWDGPRPTPPHRIPCVAHLLMK